ncbi:NPCBM/NEW2 domain-containing protein [Actinophytocola sp.]|uniref:NPCBM/NEW2 domain-containing protein n=1 Tax=Actinophytocola sp. TaxID=1872138 RepID=UPI00389B1482
MPSITVVGKAFVSFRIGDADDAATLIDRRLCRAFGTDRVHRSSPAMHRGAPFPPTLEAEAADCAVMVVVIGERWLAEHDGTRRLDDPADWVREEIEFALANGRPVLPVLTGDRPPLGEDDDLPATLTGLLGRPHLRFRATEPALARIVDEVRPHLDGVVAPARATRLVDIHPTTRSSDVRLGAFEVDGRRYDESIVFHAFASLVSFNLGMRYRRLEVTAAVPAKAGGPDQAGIFTVLGDGRVLAQVTASREAPRSLTVDVTDVLTLKLTAHRVAGAAELAWVDPVVHP